MDPSGDACLIVDSFTEAPNVSILPPPYISKEEFIPQSKITIGSQTENVYCDQDIYNQLLDTKNQFPQDPDVFNRARNAANPVEFLGNSIFMNRAPIKLANIDAVFNVTHHYGGSFKRQSEQRFRFCDLAGGPGGFTQYIQYRQRQATGFGITLAGSLDWKKELIDCTRFIYVYGEDNTGNLYVNWKTFYEQAVGVNAGDTIESGDKGSLPPKQAIIPFEGADPTQMQHNPLGYHLIVADGGIEIEGNYERQEFLSTHLILIEVLLALKLLMKDGNFVCKFFNTITPVSAQLLYIVSQCFEEVYLFKPISSRPANEEKYLVAKVFKNNADPYLPILENAAKLITEMFLPRNDSKIISLFDSELPSNFVNWLVETNNKGLLQQQVASVNILKAANDEVLDLPKYDLHKFFIIWNLPDTPPRSLKFKVPYRGSSSYRGKDRYETYQGQGRGRGRGLIESAGARESFDARGRGRGRGQLSRGRGGFQSRESQAIQANIRTIQDFPYMGNFLPHPEAMLEYIQNPDNIKLTSDMNNQFLMYEGLESIVSASPVLQTTTIDYYAGNALANYFTENVRIQCSRNQKPSPLDVWRTSPDLFQKAAAVSVLPIITRNPEIFQLREAIYQESAGCNNFNITLGYYIMKLLGAKRILDPSAGWGDRAIAAIAAQVEYYVGYDPNLQLRHGYEQIEIFSRQHGVNCQFILEPFDLLDVDQILTMGAQYDLVLTSPPFFDLESYGLEAGQSTVRFPSYDRWVTDFLYPYLDRAWMLLEADGTLAIYLENVRMLKLTDILKDYIGKKNSEYRGVIGLQYVDNTSRTQTLGAIRPTFFWRKLGI